MKKILVVLLFVFSVSSANVFSAWQQVNGLNNITVFCMVNAGSSLIAGSTISILTSGDLYISNDGGSNWSIINTGMNLSGIFALAKKDNIIFAGTYEDGLLKSENGGANWSQVNVNGNFGTGIFKLGVSSPNLFAYANTGQAYYVSSNNGANWSVAGGMTGGVMNYLLNGSSAFYAATYKGLYRSTNNGFNWTHPNNFGLPTQPDSTKRLAAIIISGNTMYGSMNGPQNSVFKTTDEGTSWLYAGLTLSQNTYVKDFEISGNKIFAGVYSGSSSEYGVYMTTNTGVNWSQVNQGLPVGVSVNDLVIVNNQLFACTIQQGIWRINMDELVGINEGTHNVTPNSFSLEQNYPNPFNTITKIKFSVPSEGYTNLIVYDALGREVETLIKRNMQSGEYEVIFDASALPSGIYYYKLSAGNYSVTKKMTLIK
jgi:photosystem II stability/assembly factor-like uncharacterized protein